MNNLVKLRIKKGLSQVQISKQLQIPIPTYQRYEHGDLPGEKRVCEMAAFFGCSTDYLLGVTEVEKTEVEMLTLDEKMVLNSYHQLSETEKMGVHEYLNKLILEKKATGQSRVRVS